MKKILILGVSAVQYDSIKILNSLGYETHAIAMSADGPGVKEANQFAPINFVDKDQVIKYIKNNGIDLVYSTGSDIAMPICSKISEELNMPHFISSETAIKCNNKCMMRETLGQDTKGNIPYQRLTDINDKIILSFPFIMKPADSQGQRGINIINSVEDFRKHFENTRSFSKSSSVIIERIIEGPEISVNAYMIDGELKFMAISDRVGWPQFTGLIHKHVINSGSFNEEVTENVRETILEVAKKMKIENGPFYLQMKVEGKIPYVIEVTPRIDGCHMWNLIERVYGFNMLKLLYEHLLDNNVSELDKYKESDEMKTLEFICQEPNTMADFSKINKPESYVDEYYYYEDGDKIRPVNGKYDKIGYFIY